MRFAIFLIFILKVHGTAISADHVTHHQRFSVKFVSGTGC